MNDDIFLAKVKNISKQFLCSFPLIKFDWQNLFDTFMTESQQEYLLSKTVNSELVLKYPLKINYQKLFLKYVLDRLENSQTQESVIHDDVYSSYVRLVAAGDNFQENYKHYLINVENEKDIITLKESNSLITDGTTGLRTWQASLALSEWIVQNKTEFNDKSVLELGSGIGLTGLVLVKNCSLKSIYLTDCHETVLENLSENIKINRLNISKENQKIDTNNIYSCGNLKNRCLFNLFSLSILNLPWENFYSEICKELGNIDKVFAADIVYDKDLFKPLINAIQCLKEYCNVKEFIFSCTERNPTTLEDFLSLMRQIFRHVEQVETPEQSIFLWLNDTPVKIYKFKDLIINSIEP